MNRMMTVCRWGLAFIMLVCAHFVLFAGAKVESTTLNPPKPTVSKGTYSGYVKISWKKVSGAQGYYIRRGTSTTFSKSSTLTKLSGGSKVSFNDTSATKGKKYYYWVCPYKGGYYYYKTSYYAQGWRKGTSSSLTPPKPTASQGTNSSYVKITWKKVSGAQGYYIKRATSKTFSSAVTIKKLTSGSKTSYNDTSAAKGKKYYYWVCPYKGGYYYYNTSYKSQGWRKGASSSTSSYTISGSTSVKQGSIFTMTFKKGGNTLVGDWYCNSRIMLISNTRGSSGRFMALTPGTGTIYVVYGGKTYTKNVTVKTTVSNGGGGTGISGPGTLQNSQRGVYSLKVGGKTITSGVSWSYSSSLRKASSSGGKITLYPVYSSRPIKKAATVTAKYNGKTYSMTIYAYY